MKPPFSLLAPVVLVVFGSFSGCGDDLSDDIEGMEGRIETLEVGLKRLATIYDYHVNQPWTPDEVLDVIATDDSGQPTPGLEDYSREEFNFFNPDGSIIPYDDMTKAQRAGFTVWVGEATGGGYFGPEDVPDFPGKNSRAGEYVTDSLLRVRAVVDDQRSQADSDAGELDRLRGRVEGMAGEVKVYATLVDHVTNEPWTPRQVLALVEPDMGDADPADYGFFAQDGEVTPIREMTETQKRALAHWAQRATTGDTPAGSEAAGMVRAAFQDAVSDEDDRAELLEDDAWIDNFATADISRAREG